MFESPRSLQKVCMDFICDNILAICDINPSGTITRPSSNSSNSSNESSSGYSSRSTSSYNLLTDYPQKLSFKDPDIFLPAEISEQLLHSFCERNMLTDFSIALFDAKSTRLKHVKLKNASRLSIKGLTILREHKVVDLEVKGLKIAINDLIACLGSWSLQNLRSLSVAEGSFMDCSKYCVLVALSNLRALQTLNVSGTEFNRHGLDIIVEDLPFLENLDISLTQVDDISPLKKCKDRLKTLIMYNVKTRSYQNVISVLVTLNELRNLDISDDMDSYVFEMFAPSRSKITDLLRAVHCMPHLVSLDISGRNDIDVRDLKKFIRAHPKLKFLGLVHSDVCYEDSLTNSANRNYRADLVVSGTATEPQILEALKRYSRRPAYVQKCLYNLFRLTSNSDDVRVDMIKLVIPGMKAHSQEFRIQIAGTACLYNLTKGELSNKIHPSILKQVVDVTLTAMQSYPNHYQMQKNTILTLCSDRILQDVPFNKYRCARLVMNNLSAFNDSSMNRMSVAICSILASKMSTVETSLLGAQPRYMSKLLTMVRSKVEAKCVDITMKFTLSALWNLTDESATTCKVFLQEGGMKLFLEMLETFHGESSIETKVLGLLNNIAEVNYLRQQLIQPRFISMLSFLLDSEHIDVSYFAAGIAAHILSDNDNSEFWSTPLIHPSRSQLLDQLARAVINWKTPQSEMVAYRSFHPFFPLLKCTDVYAVQLWAVWAIHHVCTKNPKRYCEMLIRDDGVKIIETLEKECSQVNTQPNVRTLCQAILNTLAQQNFC